MSPVSASKVSDPAGARVQVPFTLSDTRTCPGALYWANHPTSRSPWATGRVSGTVSAGTLDPVENASPWTKVGVVAPTGPARAATRSRAGPGDRIPAPHDRARGAARHSPRFRGASRSLRDAGYRAQGTTFVDRARCA